MPTTQDLVEVDNLLDGVSPILLECTEADDLLRSRGHRHVLTRVHARFEFSAVRRQGERFVFALRRRNSVLRLADFGLEFELRPSAFPPPPQALERAPIRARLLPDFLLPRPMVETVALRLVDNTTFARMLDVPNDPGIETRALLAILWTIAAWIRAGRPGREVPLGEGLAYERVVYQIVDELVELLVDHEQRAASSEAPWALTKLGLQLQARLDQNGEIRDPLDQRKRITTHRLDARIELRHDRGGLTQVLVVDQMPCDLRLGANDVRPFMVRLRTPLGRRRIREALIDHLRDTSRSHGADAQLGSKLQETLSNSQLEQFLAMPEHDEQALAMSVRDKELETLIALRGSVGGARIEFVLLLPRSDDGNITDQDLRRIVVLLATLDVDYLPRRTTVPPGNRAHTYIRQLVETLERWQRTEVGA
jgi:hypothetical protein